MNIRMEFMFGVFDIASYLQVHIAICEYIFNASMLI